MKLENLLTQIRQHLQAHDFLFTDSVLSLLTKFAEHSTPKWLAGKTPEYHKQEYLLNVTQAGMPTQPSSEAIAHIQNHPILKHWFCILHNTVCMARWLVHLCGFRHRCIHLFLDPQQHPNTTYVQIRSFKKYNEPGGFDMPVAGHVSNSASFEQALHAESAEELGLNLNNDVIHLRHIGTNNIAVTPLKKLPDYFEVEHTAIYRATLNDNAYHRIRFTDGEVAALAQFQIDELAHLIQRYPERVGGGLRDSFPLYLEDNNA